MEQNDVQRRQTRRCKTNAVLVLLDIKPTSVARRYNYFSAVNVPMERLPAARVCTLPASAAWCSPEKTPLQTIDAVLVFTHRIFGETSEKKLFHVRPLWRRTAM